MPKQGDKATCRHCRKEIEYIETSIDDFWAHVDGIMTCDGTRWASGKPTAEPTISYIIIGQTSWPNYQLHSCLACGAVVHDTERHTNWHYRPIPLNMKIEEVSFVRE